MLGHGAGGAAYGGAGGAAYGGASLEPDLIAARDAALRSGLDVVLVEQPWRVAGRRVAESPARLDEAWLAVLGSLPTGVATVVGGRSAGARVACRTASLLADVVGVLCLAFPLQPPRSKGPAPSRAAELDLPRVPVLVVQGGRDPFGVPGGAPGRGVVTVPGADHSFDVRRRDGERTEALRSVESAVRDWLVELARPGNGRVRR